MSRFFILLFCLTRSTLASATPADALKSLGLEAIHDSTPAVEMTDRQGKIAKLSDYKGHALVIHFWATWCEPCKVEMPDLINAIAKTRTPDVAFIALSVDEAAQKSEVEKFLTGLKPMTPLEIIVPSEASKRFFAWGIPMTYFINSHGTVVARARGSKDWAHVSQKDLRSFLETLKK